MRTVSILIVAGVAFGQTSAPIRGQPEWHRGPFLDLKGPRTVATRYVGATVLSQARALSTAAADFDEDGMPDLVAGFATVDGAGAVVIHRGNIDVLWPYGRPADPPAFLPDARVFSLPEAPDFLAAGDFDADGHWDIVAAHTGSTALWFLKGDGHGGFAVALRIPLPGKITAMTHGDINRADGLTDLMVAITGDSGPQVLIFESPDGALRAEPEVFDLPADVTALTILPLDGGLMNGLAVAAGHELLLIHGRDRRLAWGKTERAKVPQAIVTRQTFPFAIRALSVGNFTSQGLDLAALGTDGRVHILERSDAGMQERTAIALPVSAAASEGAKLAAARVAATSHDSVIVLDPAGRKLHIISHTSQTDPASLAVTASLDMGIAPAAVQPMRINKDPLADLVILGDAQTEPLTVETAPGITFTVADTSDDPNDSGSLRYAIVSANYYATTIGSYEIDFNIPASDPDLDPATGVFLIQPGAIQPASSYPALPPNGVIDAYTQPGSSPNSSATADNARPLIQISGGLLGPGVNGLTPGGDTIRGLVITEFQGSGQPTANGAGIFITSAGNLIEGNFVGIDGSGTFAEPNAVGVVLSVTPLADTIGGTALQARNILSGNSFAGFATFASAPLNSQFLEGNFIGTDRTGANGVSNGSGGGVNAASGSSGTVIGGTAAGAGNVISGNQTNLYLSGRSFLIQGNSIGMDATGTHAVGGGYGVIVQTATANTASFNTIGGTTPAARNIISSNAVGVDLNQYATSTLVEGNYIGADVTGTKAAGNGIGVSFDAMTDPASGNLIGGDATGSGNLISGNLTGIIINSVAGSSAGNTITGNLIGTDATGANPLGNSGDGILMQNAANQNTVGGTDAGEANIIAYNSGNGVNINPGAGDAGNNSVIGNVIDSNGGAGVNIATGTGNLVSRNRIYANGALGIDLNSAGVLPANACQANTAGANLLQNAPVLTAGTGAVSVSATATDPNGNTSEFSNCVPVSSASGVLSITGSLNSTASTTFTIEYFSNTSCDPSGSGQGKAYLGSTTVTTGASCTASLNFSPNTGNADLSVAYATPSAITQNTPFSFTSLVSNSGASAASAVTWTDALPAGLVYLSATTTYGGCGFAAGSITCILGTLPAGDVANIKVSAAATLASAFTNTVSVSSTTPDPNSANNSASFTRTPVYSPQVTQLVPASIPAGSPDTIVTLVGTGFTAASQVTFGGTVYPATFNPNYCTPPAYCTALAITVPAAKLAAVSTVQVGIGTSTLPFNITTAIGPVTHFVLQGLPNPYPSTFAETLQISAEDANGNVVPTYTGTVKLTSSDPKFTVSNTGGTNTLQFLASASGTATPTVTLTTFGTQSVTATDTSNSAVTGSLTGIVVSNGPAYNLILSGSPQATSPGTAFAQPLAVLVTDVAGNPVPNQKITFSAPASGASAALSGTTATTDSHGKASLMATANSVSGTYAVGVTFGAGTPSGGDNADVFLLNNGSGLATLTVISPLDEPLSLAIGQPQTLQVLLKDGLGNDLTGVNVYFTSTNVSGGYALVTSPAVTSQSGVASSTASVPENATPDVLFSIIATAGGLAATFPEVADGVTERHVVVTASGGTPQAAILGTPFGQPLVASVTDGSGNPKAGALVTFQAPTSGATAVLSAVNAVTDSNGNATIAATANNTQGNYNVTASVDNSKASFALTNTPQSANPPAKIVILGIFGQGDLLYLLPGSSTEGGVTGGPYQIEVEVVDTNGNPVTGATVKFTAPSTGASATFAGTGATSTVVSDLNGLAISAEITNNTVAGSYVITITAGKAVGIFGDTNDVAFPTKILISGNNQTATINTNFAPVTIQVVDQYGNSGPAGGDSCCLISEWSLGSASNGASATSPGATFGGSVGGLLNFPVGSTMLATLPTLTANGVAGTYTGRVFLDIGVLHTNLIASFTLTNTTTAAATITAVSGTPQSTAADASFGSPLSAKVTDSNGNPLAGFAVNFTTPASGPSATFSSPSAVTNSAGIATATATANGIAGAYRVTASSGSVSTTFTLDNIAMPVCDVNRDGAVNVLDGQAMVNEALGLIPALNDLNGDGAVNVMDIQIVLNAALILGCTAQ